MAKGICVAGNMIVDIIYPTDGWAGQGKLTNICGDPEYSTGGLANNVLMDMAHLDSDLPLTAIGIVGDDKEGDMMLKKFAGFKNIDQSRIARTGISSFTLVMHDVKSNQRSFFIYRGSGSLFDESYIDWDNLDCDLIHAGYILLNDALDAPDEEYGTKLARLLHDAKARGIKTSTDVVTENSDRAARLAPYAMKYLDYFIINEMEAQQITGITLVDENGPIRENIFAALDKMHDMGVSTWSVIHCPQGGYGRDENGNHFALPSLKLPDGFIKGSVGAGDAFCAGVLYAAYKGWNMEEALKLGICTAASSLSEAGSTEGVKTVSEVMSLYAQYPGSF